MGFKINIRNAGLPLLAAAFAIPATDVAAQQLAIEELIVTARKRNENLLEVPLNITAFSETELERQNIIALEDLAAFTPSLQFQDVNGAFQNPAIRGLSQTDQISPQGNVGVFLDGVYLNNRSGLEFGLLDVARIEVVKGPQSALYGRNTFGGAINYVTKQPELGEFGGRIEATGGTHKRHSLAGNVNIPLGDVAALRVFGGFSEFGGTIPNLRDGNKLGGWKDKDAIGGTLRIEPGENTVITAFAMYNKVDNETPALRLSDASTNNCGSPTVNPFGVPRFTLFCGVHEPPRDANLVEGARGLFGETELYYAKIEHDFDFATVSILGSHLKSNFRVNVDTAGNPNAINIPLFIPGLSVQSLLDASTPQGDADSLEIRITSPDDDRKLAWSVGAFFYDSVDVDTLGFGFLPLGEPDGELVPFFNSDREVDTRASSAFGSLTYRPNDKLTLSVEARYTHEKQVLVNSVIPQGEEQDFDFFAPRFTADYQINDDLLVYANVGRGVKVGGFAPGAPVNLPEFRSFNEETNWSYEIGTKGTFWDGRLVATVAAWYVDWKDLQIQTQVPGGVTGVVQNFGAARSTGIEFDTSVSVTDNFTIRGAMSIMDPEFKDGSVDGEVRAACGEFPGTIITEPGCTAEVGGNRMTRVSSFQYSVSGTYTIPAIFQDFDLYFRGDFSHENGKFNSGLNFGNQGKIDLANARVGLSNENLEISIWVDNVFDRHWNRRVTSVPFVAEGAPASGVTQYRIYPGETRTAGIDLRYNF